VVKKEKERRCPLTSGKKDYARIDIRKKSDRFNL
jgi:hypothetical protein